MRRNWLTTPSRRSTSARLNSTSPTWRYGPGLSVPLCTVSPVELDGVDLSQAMLEEEPGTGSIRICIAPDLVEFVQPPRQATTSLQVPRRLFAFGDIQAHIRGCGGEPPGGRASSPSLFFPKRRGQGVAGSALNGLGEGVVSCGRGYVGRVRAQCGYSIVLMNTEVHERHRGNVNQGGLGSGLASPS